MILCLFHLLEAAHILCLLDSIVRNERLAINLIGGGAVSGKL